MDLYHASRLSATGAALTPAMSAPAGRVSELAQYPNVLWGWNILAQTSCMIIGSILFFLRCHVRLGFSRLPRMWDLEDWMVVLSFIGLTIYSALTVVMVDNNGGVHEWNLTEEQAQSALYWFWIETIIYGPFIFVTKLSIFLLYFRLLVPTRWSVLWTTIHIFTGISACFYIILTAVKIFQCSPIEQAWKRQRRQGDQHCINMPVVLQVSGLFNAISDALILLVPIKACWNLQFSLKKKMAICAVFTIGAVGPIFSALGLYCRINAAKSLDLTFEDPRIILWATAEITTGVICVCLPTLPPLFRKPRNLGTSTTTSYSRKDRAGASLSSTSYPQNRALGYGTYVELEESRDLGVVRTSGVVEGRKIGGGERGVA